jgi:hypothetical protein
LEGTLSPRTLFLSKLIGLYCLLIGLSMMTRGQATVETVTALLQNSAMTLILGVFTLAAGGWADDGLAHNTWSGCVLAVVVTLIGWMALVKSLFFLILPNEMEAGLFLGQLHGGQLFYVYAAISFALGLCLTYGGFRSLRSPHEVSMNEQCQCVTVTLTVPSVLVVLEPVSVAVTVIV